MHLYGLRIRTRMATFGEAKLKKSDMTSHQMLDYT